MKKYLFGLGAMLVGAGLMFVLMHGEVRAGSHDDLHPFFCSTSGVLIDNISGEVKKFGSLMHCVTDNLDCGYTLKEGNVSCVKRGLLK